MKKLLTSLILLVGLFVIAGCGSDSSSGEEKKKIKIGATAGPYSDQLQHGIAPILEKEGYTLEIVEFNDYVQPNKALDEGDLDANLFQNIIYLEQFNIDHDMDLVASYAVPTAPIGLYSEKYESLDDIEEGAKITLPNDPTNLARSLHMLVDYGWIETDQDVSQTTVSERDILENKYNLDIQPIEAAQTARSLGDADLAFVNGNFALSSGLEFSEAVDTEDTSEGYLNYVTVRSEDEDKDFAKALEKAYRSEEFLEYTNDQLAGYVKPPYQKELEAN